MELGAMFIGLAMLVATVPVVARPLKEKKSKPNPKSTNFTNPDEQKQTVLLALSDLDFDFRTGKVSDDDYSLLRAQLVAEAATYIQSENSIEDDQIEAMIKARKASQAKVQECPNCGKETEAGSHFCSHCGKAVETNCPSCSKAVQISDLFCKACGTKLEFNTEHIA